MKANNLTSMLLVGFLMLTNSVSFANDLDIPESATFRGKPIGKECRAAMAKQNFCVLSKLSRKFGQELEQKKSMGSKGSQYDQNTRQIMIRSLTSRISEWDAKADHEKEKFQKYSGSSISASDCQLKDVAPMKVKLPKTFFTDVKKTCGTTEFVLVDDQ